MGAGSSVKRSPASMQSEIERLRKRELDREEEEERRRGAEEMATEARLRQVQSERDALAVRLRETARSLREQEEGWRREKSKALALMFSDLPLSLLTGHSSDVVSGEPSLSKHFPMATIAHCGVVGFASTVARLQPQEAIKLVDRLHGTIDEAYHHQDIFVMERTSEGCTAAAGLREVFDDERTTSTVSLTDSSYGSELELELSDPQYWSRDKREARRERPQATPPAPQPPQSPSHFASLLASASLRLLSASTRVSVPRSHNPQLQLRIALHSGACSAGVIGLQTTAGVTRIPRYKLFGPTVRFAGVLCGSGLALQVRVSRQCRELLLTAGGFQFERCPDYMGVASGKAVESYWLVGREGLDVKLPTLDRAVPLREYDDIEL